MSGRVNPFKVGRGSARTGSVGGDGGQPLTPRGYRLSESIDSLGDGTQAMRTSRVISPIVVESIPAVPAPQPTLAPSRQVQRASSNSEPRGLPVPGGFDGGLPALPGDPSMWGDQYAASPTPANRPDWGQAPAGPARPQRGLRARASRVRRPGSEGIGARSTMEMMHREYAQARFQGGQSADSGAGSPAPETDYEFRQAPAQQATAPAPDAASAGGFDSLDEFVDLSKPSKFKKGRSRANMLLGHDGRPAKSESSRSPARGGVGKAGGSGRPALPASSSALGDSATPVNVAAGFDAPSTGVSMITSVKLFYKKYARFAGRASKSEYWWVMLFMGIASMALSIVPLVGPLLLAVVTLGSLVPGLALTWRRAHDADKPWFPWLYVGSTALATVLTLAASASMLFPGLVGEKLMGGLVLVDLLFVLFQLALAIILGVLPSKPSGARFDKK